MKDMAATGAIHEAPPVLLPQKIFCITSLKQGWLPMTVVRQAFGQHEALAPTLATDQHDARG